MKNCIHTLKLGLWVEFFGEFFCGQYYWYTSIESRAIWKFKVFGWNFIKIYIFKKITIKVKYSMYLKKKSTPNERERDFIVGHCINFSDFFCLVMFHEPQTWSPMADESLHIICTDFIQSSSSNYWIEINLDLK
jgi:hypothetical protein